MLDVKLCKLSVFTALVVWLRLTHKFGSSTRVATSLTLTMGNA